MRTDTVDLTDQELIAILETDWDFDGPVSQAVENSLHKGCCPNSSPLPYFCGDPRRRDDSMTSSPAPRVPLVRIGNFPFHKDIHEGTLREILG